MSSFDLIRCNFIKNQMIYSIYKSYLKKYLSIVGLINDYWIIVTTVSKLIKVKSEIQLGIFQELFKFPPGYIKK